MFLSIAKQAGSTGCVIIKTLTEQEQETMRRKGILNLLTEEKKLFSTKCSKQLNPEIPREEHKTEV